MVGIWRTMIIVTVGFVLFASVLGASSVAAAPATAPHPAKNVSITLYGSFTNPAGWGRGPNNITEPGPTLTVTQGDVVTFSLYSNDTMAHQLVIDIDNSHTNTTGDGWSFQFSSKTVAATFTYTANTVGTFAYFCNVHTYNAQHGTFVVNAAPAPPPSSDNTLLIAGGGVAIVVIVAGIAAVMMRRRKPKQPPQT